MIYVRSLIFLSLFACAGVPAIATPDKVGEIEKDKRLEYSKIEQAQKKLNQFGFELVEDGILGFQTRNALSKFQQDRNLKPTGQLDRKTLQALGVEDDGHVGVPTSMNPNDLTKTTAKDKKIENSQQKDPTHD